MGLSFFIKLVLAQCALAAIIVVVLKKVLDNELIDLAIHRLDSLPKPQGSMPLGLIIVISSKDLSLQNKERILKIVTRLSPEAPPPVFKKDKSILGGMVLAVGEQTFEYSLKDRLKRAFSGKAGS